MVVRIFFISILFFFFARAIGAPPVKEIKNILLINSYQQGYGWTDGVTLGIINEFNSKTGYKLFIEYLNSKQFGQTQFDLSSDYFLNKYADIPIAGVLVADNDALDFALKIEKNLFPNVPAVFVGISNPEDYHFEGTNYFGFKEGGNTDGVLELIMSLFPGTKKILVIADESTTGKIYRENFIEQKEKFPGLNIIFPKVLDVDSICSQINFGDGFDIIFSIEINQDRNGKPIDNLSFIERIGKLSKVPLFSNSIDYLGKGVTGGFYHDGQKHGSKASKLLFQLIDTPNRESFSHVNNLDQQAYFDMKLLKRFGISTKKLPKGAIIANNQSLLNKRNFGVLLTVLLFLVLLVFFLLLINRKRKKEQIKSESQLREIEIQRNQLEKTSLQLNNVISELEKTNTKLNETNANLLQAKKKAEESDNLKSAFLANVSHEIRTPLNSIVGFSSLLVDSTLSEENRTMYSDMIESNSESLLVLIDEIIDLSKIEAQQLSISKQEFCLDGLLTELYQVFKNNHKNSPVELRVAKISESNELVIFSDRVRVKQIFINLLTNAYKFTESGFIEFGYILSGAKEIQFYVKDSGIGIEEEYQQVVFDRFMKLNTEKGKVYAGTGLGLSITRKLVELLGGKIWIDSEPGEGATFYFTLSSSQTINSTINFEKSALTEMTSTLKSV
jgi:signal transduction histidine kinase